MNDSVIRYFGSDGKQVSKCSDKIAAVIIDEWVDEDRMQAFCDDFGMCIPENTIIF
jgi:hypothetical protein